MENKILLCIDFYKKKKTKISNQKFPSKDFSFKWVHEIRLFSIIPDIACHFLFFLSLSLSFRSKQFFQRTRNLRSWRDRNGQLEGNVCTHSVKNTMENTKFRVEF